MSTTPRKVKLRTASDVMARLKWSHDDDNGDYNINKDIILGYDDRIHGPMEKPVADYVPIQHGGDIPEHRIWYFRRQHQDINHTTSLSVLSSLVLWDRLSRIDRLFGSGEGEGETTTSSGTIIHEQTLHNIQQAVATMERLEEEKQERRWLKEKEKQRRTRLRARRTGNTGVVGAVQNTVDGMNTESSSSRYQWEPVDWYEYSPDEKEWRRGSHCDKYTTTTAHTTVQHSNNDENDVEDKLTIITWNVLFDLYPEYDSSSDDIGDDAEGTMDEKGHMDSSEDNNTARWRTLIRHLATTSAVDDDNDNHTISRRRGGAADILALQEVTPDFVELLCAQDWIQREYATLAAPGHVTIIHPTGNLLLWRKSRLAPYTTVQQQLNNNNIAAACWACVDQGIKRRGAIVALQPRRRQERNNEQQPHDQYPPRFVLLVTSLHLLADQFGKSGFRKSAALARKRELSATIGQLQKMENEIYYTYLQYQKSGGVISFPIVPMILGDFNANEQQDELADGCFSGEAVVGGSRVCQGFFVDAWASLVASKRSVTGHHHQTIGSNHNDSSVVCCGSSADEDDQGFTFDPRSNPRAAHTRSHTGSQSDKPKRLDRIYVARQWLNHPTTPSTASERDDVLLMAAVKGNLLGKEQEGEMPPSDHYGLQMTFALKRRRNPPVAIGRSLYDPMILDRNAWASSSMSTTDTLLGLLLGESRLGQVDLFDPESTLPIPHVTLLHGFVDLSTSDACTLAVQACQNAIDEFARQQQQLHGYHLNPHQQLVLPFSPSSMDVFEHQSIATLVALPDTQCPEGAWIRQLYQCLTKTFRQCHHQESRFASRWNPHVSLGTFGTVNTARAQAVSLRGNGWIVEPRNVPVHAVTLFQRDKSNNKIYAVASLPLVRIPKTTSKIETQSFLSNMGESWSSRMQGFSDAVIIEIGRACRETSLELGYGQAHLRVCGSHALGVSMPDLSDVDMVVELHPPEGRASFYISTTQFFQRVTSYLMTHFVAAKVRLRVAGTGTSPLHILTAKLWSSAPSADVLLCVLDSNGQPNDSRSAIAYNTVRDTLDILESIKETAFEAKLPQHVDIIRVYQGTLRLVKLWAWRRNVYGANAGFLGGGGWAVFLARILNDGLRSGRLSLDAHDVDMSKLSLRLTNFFFRQASAWPGPFVVTLSRDLPTSASALQAIDTAATRGSMAVLAPCSQGNHGRNSTRSTTHATLFSLGEAATKLAARSADESDKSVWVDLLRSSSLKEDLAVYAFVILAEMSVSERTFPGRQTVPDLKAWGSAQVLRLVVDIEQEFMDDGSSLRLFPRPIRKDKKTGTKASPTFVWMIGFLPHLSATAAAFRENNLDSFLTKRQCALTTDLAQLFAPVSCQTSLECVPQEKALELLARK